MTRINLLPWREERRAQQQRDFLVLLALAVIIAACGTFAAHLHIASRIEYQETRNEYLRGEIDRLKRIEQEIKKLDEAKERLLARLETIENLQRSRPGMVRVFDDLARRLPEDIFLASLKTTNKDVTLKGTARNNNVVSGFMRELEQSSLFGEPVLKIVERRKITNTENLIASEFELAVNRTRLKDEDNGGEE